MESLSAVRHPVHIAISERDFWGQDRIGFGVSRREFRTGLPVEEFVTFGHRFDLPQKAVMGMIERTVRSVLKFLPVVVQDFPGPDVVAVILSRAESLAA